MESSLLNIYSACNFAEKKLIIAMLIIFSASSWTPIAVASDWGIQTRLNTGLVQYEFAQSGLFSLQGSGGGTGFSEIEFSDTMPYIGGGATLVKGDFYVSLYGQYADDGSDSDTLEQLGRTGPSLFSSTQINRDWDRNEVSIAVGYNVTNDFSVFAGYRSSETNFDERNTLDNRGADDRPPVQTFDSSLKYQQIGPFLGGNQVWRIAESGALSLNIGIAFLEGEITQTVDDSIFRYTGETVGLTMGFSWNAPLGNGWIYSVGIDGYQFVYDSDSSLSPDFSEQLMRGTLGIAYFVDLGGT